ncbi:hypothetical protein [Rheinheimera sp.]|jgi:hypothetical protein|uniref:hypothetical protein n=1 Tax=Rheinheimera sp. TaxID=1869214 RepID=UPI003D2AC229
MNKFTEQNKAAAKIDPNTTTAKTDALAKTAKDDSKAAASDTTNMSKAVAADKAKLDATTRTPAENGKPADSAKKDAFNGKWHSQIQAAKSNWSKISESELLKSGGVETNLTDLVQQRYSLSQDMASKQVKSFIDKCHC